MNAPHTILFQGKTYRLADADPYQGEVRYDFDHWAFTMRDHQIKSLVDDLQISGHEAATKLPVEGLLAFLGRMTRSQHDADKQAAKELQQLLNSDVAVREAFTETIHQLRNNYPALTVLVNCILFGPVADGQNDHLKRLPARRLSALIDGLVSDAGSYLDFTTIESFLSSFHVLPTHVLSPEG